MNLPPLILGTTNQAKHAAVILATGTEPLGVKVSSGVSDQPLSEHETIQGAINRAKNAWEASPRPTYRIGLGLEGGLHYDGMYTQQWYLFSVCAAWDGTRLTIGKGLYFPIPNQIGERVQQEGIELKTVIDELSGTTNNNHKEGAYGLFTAGQVTRANVFRDAVIAALTPFTSPLYNLK
ncbi:inosine/xanthosine triphosphatase [Brevibacillus ginsengisoli]|uniref:inosine/xanthosine triphosphatase n=1 Tax=Brevibacillus ginsengisoli TaxID=363854 RepID=UPI003CF07FAA